MANFIVCNFDDKGCKKSNGYKSMIDALRFTAGYAAAHVSTFYWGRPSHLILCWKISMILFSSLRLQIIPKGIFKFLARKEICFLLFELYFLYILYSYLHRIFQYKNPILSICSINCSFILIILSLSWYVCSADVTTNPIFERKMCFLS